MNFFRITSLRPQPDPVTPVFRLFPARTHQFRGMGIPRSGMSPPGEVTGHQAPQLRMQPAEFGARIFFIYTAA
jgi:hypothetical protein